MRNIKVNARRLALKKATIRTLDDRDLATVSSGWECSVRGSGNIKCVQVSGDSIECSPEG